MIGNKANAVFRWLAYLMEIIVVFALGNTPNLMPELFGAKPVLLLCVAMTAAIFEREIPAMVVGIVCGLLIDLGYSSSIGLFTIALTIICFFVGYAANNLIVANLRNFLLYSFLTVGGLFMLYFLFNFVLTGVEYRWTYFTRHLVSRMVQTFLYSFIFYFLNRLIFHLLGEEE